MGPWKSGRVKKKSVEEGIKDSEEQSRGRKVKNDQQKGREEKKGGGETWDRFWPARVSVGSTFSASVRMGVIFSSGGLIKRGT